MAVSKPVTLTCLFRWAYILGVTLRASLPTSVRFKQALEKDAVYFAQGAAVSEAISSVSA